MTHAPFLLLSAPVIWLAVPQAPWRHWGLAAVTLAAVAAPELILWWQSHAGYNFAWGNPYWPSITPSFTMSLKPDTDPGLTSLFRRQLVFPTVLLCFIGLDRLVQTKMWSQLLLWSGLALVFYPWAPELLGSDQVELLRASSLLGLAGLAAYGLVALQERFPRGLGLAILVAAPLLNLLSNSPSFNSRRSAILEHYVASLLDTLPQHSVLLVDDEVTAGALYYAQRIENRRPDVELVPLGLIETGASPTSADASMKELISQRPDATAIEAWAKLHSRPILATTSRRPLPPSIRIGLLLTFPQADAMPTVGEVRRECLWGLNSLNAQAPMPTPAARSSAIGRFCLLQVEQAYNDLAGRLHLSDPKLSLAAITRSMEFAESPSALYYAETGAIRIEIGERRRGEQAYLQCLELDPDSEVALQALAESADRRGALQESHRYKERIDALKSGSPEGP